MITKLEGIILSKVPFKDRHLICRLLLRSGEKISVVFYGGQGGGTKKKSSFLELGHLVKVELTRAKRDASIYSVKEWSLSWHHKGIRENHRAFYLMCAFLELSDKLVVEANLFESLYHEQLEKDSMFKVLSNAIFYLERKIQKGEQFNSDLFIFLGKTLIDQGVFPERNNCVLSGVDLSSVSEIALLDEQGGFADISCLNQDMLDLKINGSEAKVMWNYLCQLAMQKYDQLQSFNEVPVKFSNRMIDYLCYQVQVPRSEFKTFSLLV